MSSKPIASVSLDLDDKWTYMKTHGDTRWSTYPSYLEIVIPRVLKFLKERGLTITFFIVGQDAALEHNRDLLRTISDAGHEIGNHSFKHEPWLHLYLEQELAEELRAAESAIEQATGKRPKGFRGPGFSVSETVIKVLIGRGYNYDASTLPTFLGPLARAYYFFTAKLDKEERKRRAKLFGNVRDGLRPIKMHTWRATEGAITELPVTTMPLVRTPFHLSYLIYLAVFSPLLAKLYMKIAFTLCKWAKVAPSFLLHPLDFVGPNEAPELAFFPGMGLSLEQKMTVVKAAFDELEKTFCLASMQKHVASVTDASVELAEVSVSTLR
jgi:peptidoglycan/xylan/chitin deacetylase (PgdA/CDA1 family)